jgi:hypothetical protein
MKKIYTLSLIVLLAGCSKNDTPAPTTPTPPVTTVPPTVSTGTVWQLTGISIDNAPQTLTALQASFRMTFHNDGRYVDSDGVSGNWAYPSTDTLRINQVNLPTPISVKYKVRVKTANLLSLTQSSADKTIDLTYEAK